MYKALKNTDYKWAFGKFYIDNQLFNQNKPPMPNNEPARFKWFHCISTMSLIKASVKPKFDEKLMRYDDYDLFYSLTKAGHKGVFVDEVLFETFNRPGGISNPDPEVIKKHFDILMAKHGITERKIADIVIPHHNRHDHLKNCLEKLDNKLFNIIIVSGGSFSENCNKGAKLAETDNIIFLNDDTLPSNEILASMVEDDGDIVGVAQIIPKHNAIFYGIGYKKSNIGVIEARLSRKIEDVSIPSGYCFRVKKKVWLEMGGLDERFKNGAEDQDFAFRAIRDGYKINYIHTPMPHLEAQSEGRHKCSRENELILKKLWSDEALIKLLKL